MVILRLSQALQETGFIARGGFHPGPEDELPVPWTASSTLIIVGNAGDDMWKAFSKSPEYNARYTQNNPLDDWTKRSLETIAVRFNAKVILPSDGPPYFPFQRWAQRADTVFPSPIGPLIHPEFGLWHAYRGAILLPELLSLPTKPKIASPCDSCSGRPCLTSCPTNAFGPNGYDVPSCITYLQTTKNPKCLTEGCAARHACPIGRPYLYKLAQASFHQKRFLQASRRLNQ